MSQEPALEQVLAAAATKLATITNPRTWGSYPRNPIITREHLSLEEVNEFPLLIVAEGYADWRFDTTGVPGKIVIRRDPFEFAIIGYVQGDDVTPASTWMQRLADDALLALLAQQNLGINFAGVNNREILQIAYGRVEFINRALPNAQTSVFVIPAHVDVSEEVASV